MHRPAIKILIQCLVMTFCNGSSCEIIVQVLFFNPSWTFCLTFGNLEILNKLDMVYLFFPFQYSVKYLDDESHTVLNINICCCWFRYLFFGFCITFKRDYEYNNCFLFFGNISCNVPYIDFIFSGFIRYFINKFWRGFLWHDVKLNRNNYI